MYLSLMAAIFPEPYVTCFTLCPINLDVSIISPDLFPDVPSVQQQPTYKTRLQIFLQSQVYEARLHIKQRKDPSSPLTVLFYYILGKNSVLYIFSATDFQLLFFFAQLNIHCLFFILSLARSIPNLIASAAIFFPCSSTLS